MKKIKYKFLFKWKNEYERENNEPEKPQNVKPGTK